MLIYDNLKTFSRIQPDKICLINGSTVLTYQELAGKVDSVAYRMANLIKKGDKLLIKLDNAVSQLCCLLGIARLGAAAIIVDPSTPDKMCDDLMEKAGAICCVDDKFCLPEDMVQTLPEVKPEDIFLGALSSGSTGSPKLIWRDHQSWVSAFAVQSRVFGLNGADTLFLSGSLIYTANLNSCLHLLHEGGTVVIAQNSLPRTWIKEINEYNVSAIFMVPANYRTVVRAVETPLKKVKTLISAGAKMDIETVKQLMRCFPQAGVCEYYGASELGHITYSLTEDLLEHPGSVGKAFPNVKVWIEKDLIWVESPYVAPAYKPNATIGDMGEMDEEGYLYLLGRENNIINKGGFKIIPEHVEGIINRCPGITESVVIGIDDQIRGQKVAVWIIKSNSSLTVEDVKAYCRQNLPRHACPQVFKFIEIIPRNNNGKVDRNKLKSSIQK